MEVSVIVVNWNGRAFLEECLLSLDLQTHRDFEVVLVDNGSTDGSVPWLQTDLVPRLRFPLRVIQLQENLGFAEGNNRGYQACLGRYVVTLNNDTAADASWLAALVAASRADPRRMCASKILNYYDRTTLDSAGMVLLPDGTSYAAGHGDTDAGQFDHPAGALIPSACAALYPRSLIEAVGFFDPDFFTYCEDTDLGLRGLWAGYHTALVPEAVVYHKYSATAGRVSERKAYFVERNHFWVALKNFPARDLAAVPLYTLLRCAWQALAVLSGRGAAGELAGKASAAAVARLWLQATRDALAGAPRMLRKRARLRLRRAVSAAQFRSVLARHRGSFRELALGQRVG